MRFSNGSTRVGFQTVLLITPSFFLQKKLDSFLSYQLVEADLLVCMPALGDRIKVGFDEIDKSLACLYNILTSEKSKNRIKTVISKTNSPKFN